MTKQLRIQALKIAGKYVIEVTRLWWSPFQNVKWEVIGATGIVLSYDQYRYLSHNKFIKMKEEIIKGNKGLFTISELGEAKLQTLLN